MSCMQRSGRGEKRLLAVLSATSRSAAVPATMCWRVRLRRRCRVFVAWIAAGPRGWGSAGGRATGGGLVSVRGYSVSALVAIKLTRPHVWCPAGDTQGLSNSSSAFVC
jgi:hypothetical protein